MTLAQQNLRFVGTGSVVFSQDHYGQVGLIIALLRSIVLEYK